MLRMRPASISLTALALVLLACRGEDAPTRRRPRGGPTALSRPAAEVVPDEKPSAALEPSLAAWVRASSVGDDDFGRRVFYSWTSRATAERLRHDKELFDDAKLPEGPTAYVRLLEHEASKKSTAGKIARLLLGHPDLARRRYAWVRPWATRLGLGERDYGGELIAVRLKADALVARFDPESPAVFRVVDLDGRAVPLARLLRDPSKLGAVLHVRRGTPSYREYVLCNQAMVEQWSVGTPAIGQVIAADAAALRAIAAREDAATILSSARAFDVPRYEATPANLEAIATALDASPQLAREVAVAPTRTFDLDAEPLLVQVRRWPPRFFPQI
jgi:hypothetical protein